VELKCQTDVVVVEGVEWIWGLTGDFGLKMGKEKFWGGNHHKTKVFDPACFESAVRAWRE
jgi:hypothetical protein